MRRLFFIAPIFALNFFVQNPSKDLVGTWSHKNNDKESRIIFSQNGSYKMENLESEQIVFPIKVGNWKARNDTLILQNMDRLDRNGKSLLTDPNVLYFRDISMRITLKNDTLIFYEKHSNGETENVFTKVVKG